MARGGRLPRAAGRPPRFLRTGHQRAISLSDAHLQAARGTPDTRSSVRPRASFNRSCSTGHRARERKGGIPRPGRGRPQRRRGARVRGGLFAAAEVADAGPGHRSQTRRAVLRDAAALPRLSVSDSDAGRARCRRLRRQHRRRSDPGQLPSVPRVAGLRAAITGCLRRHESGSLGNPMRPSAGRHAMRFGALQPGRRTSGRSPLQVFR